MRELRSVAQLRMLHSLAARLNRLNDVNEIGDAVTAELKTLIDYHNCRIYLLADDAVTLEPIVFRGELTEYEGETYEELVAKVGEGITGHVAETGESFYTPNALEVDFAVQIEGTSEVVESILAVPLLYGDRVTGVVVLSNLGYDEFDEQDMQLLEVLASHAAVAFENARLFQKEREAAETSSALLRLSQVLTGVHDVSAVLARAVAEVPELLPAGRVAAYVRDPETGAFAMTHAEGLSIESTADVAIDADTAARFLESLDEPFVLPLETVAQVPARYRFGEEPRAVLVAPLRWEPDGFAALAVLAPDERTTFTDRDLRLARGIADITSLALGSARRFHELERFHELVQSLEAVFWEADPRTLQFRFLSQRAESMLTGPAGSAGAPERWGDHIDPQDRERALTTVRETIQGTADRNVEYRTAGLRDEPVWLRDVVHVVRDPQRDPVALRGLMVDITERKRAEQALRRSERKYSEAFRREREATQRLRALDEMKNTFLEAVSHDLRTPLTSILGSALTLEQVGLDLPRADSLDLIHRIAGNSRKLEKLLSDLLDLDRLQRGIVSPQRRPTDLSALVEHAVRESDLLSGHPVVMDLEPVVVSVDAAKVERIVENLLANAGRHTPAATRLWVRVRPQDGGALLMVDDEGPGIPTELKEEVFEPFRQGKSEATHSPGVGVGLSLVARFAELHGGRAWVEDRPGGGASFRVFLPDA
ncbi:MAG TPA: ATP-binding protein [Actinomycetota bacterium]